MLNTVECATPVRPTTQDICRQLDESIEELLALSGAIRTFVTGEGDASKESIPDIRCFNDELQNKDRMLRKVRGNLRAVIDGMGVSV